MMYVKLMEVRMALISTGIAAKPCLAGEHVAWLEFPHSEWDETTTFKHKSGSATIGHPESL